MQPLLRVVPRRAFESIAYSAGLPSLRLPIRPSTCLQCRIRSGARGFADDSKPIIPASPASIPKDDPSQPAKDEPPAEELPSSEESRRLALTKRFSYIMDNLQGNIFLASQRINDLTGYSGIEALKQRIVKLEQRVQDAQEAVRSSRITYKTTVADRASTQREVTTLLARKDSWTPTDLERFTSLYRNDHSNEQAVQEAATRLADAEREAEHAATTLSSSILSRYHEEQIWSDKIRRMSTWGTWGLMGVNIFLFLVFQLGFEPWRRKRLVHGFEEKVREALELEKAKQASEHNEVETVPLDGLVAAGVQELEAESEAEAENTNTPEPAVDAVVACIEGDVSTEVDPVILPEITEIQRPTLLAQLKKPETYQKAFQDLFSERLVSMRKQDVTLIALEGAATGAALAIAIGSLIVRHS